MNQFYLFALPAVKAISEFLGLHILGLQFGLCSFLLGLCLIHRFGVKACSQHYSLPRFVVFLTSKAHRWLLLGALVVAVCLIFGTPNFLPHSSPPALLGGLLFFWIYLETLVRLLHVEGSPVFGRITGSLAGFGSMLMLPWVVLNMAVSLAS